MPPRVPSAIAPLTKEDRQDALNALRSLQLSRAVDPNVRVRLIDEDGSSERELARRARSELKRRRQERESLELARQGDQSDSTPTSTNSRLRRLAVACRTLICGGV